MKTGNQKRKYAHNRYEDIDKYIWKVFDTFGHDEKIENLVYWTRKLQKERAEFRKKAVKYDELMKPKKPIVRFDLNEAYKSCFCPSCDDYVFLGYEHCPKCAQKLDWSDMSDEK